MICRVQVYELHSGAQFDVFESEHRSSVVVVLVHGSLDRAAGMARLYRLIAPNINVVRYDRRGYGSRWDHTGPFNVDGNVDDVEAILAGRKAIVIGHSYGGQVALAAADRLGDQVLGVSVYETPLSWMPWWPTDTAGAIGVSAGPQDAAEAFMVRMIGQDRWNGLPDKTKKERRREGPALVGELSALRDGPSWDPKAVKCPVLGGIGSFASQHHVKANEWLCSSLPHATRCVIEGAGHGAHQSHAQQFFQQLVLPHIDAVGTLTSIC